jgi:hypothetical protein
MERHRTTIAASPQPRHRALQSAAARVPASIVGRLSSSDDHRPANVAGSGAPSDDIRGPTTCGTRKSDDIRPPTIVGRRKPSNEAPNPATFVVRKPSELRRRLSERECRRARLLLRRARPVQCQVQRAQCCPAKHPDGYREVPF